MQLKETFNAITTLKNSMGLPYSKEKGCNINIQTEDTWETYVKVWLK
jgi:hypothetical protein